MTTHETPSVPAGTAGQEPPEPESTTAQSAEVARQKNLDYRQRAIIGGLLGLLVLFFVAYAANQPALVPFCWPMLVVGLALLAGAAGSVASASQPGWTATGAAAIAVIFAFVFKSPATNYVLGDIKDTSQFRDLRIHTNNALLVGRRSVADPFRFVAFEEDLRSQTFYIVVAPHDGQEFYIGCLPTELLKRSSNGSTLEFSLVQTDDRWLLRDGRADSKAIGEFGRQSCAGPVASTEPRLPVALWNAVIGNAYAQASAQLEPRSAVRNLSSASAELRDISRATIATRTDARSITELVRDWDVDNSTVETDYGLIFGWVNAIQRDRKLAGVLANTLSTEQRNRIVLLMGHKDLTVRYSATELTLWLLQSTGAPDANPEAADGVIRDVLRVYSDASFRSEVAANGAYDYRKLVANVTTAISGAACAVPADRRDEVAGLLTDSARSMQSLEGMAAMADRVLSTAALVKNCRDTGRTARHGS
ncbi:hypothetical protein [Tahibacter amnicola]|uniref:Uncharacterized protein n=1 Tax=Tahibacter amnicola TaxID=2976241 RepID=A0ABY6B9P7_9GAMM|nr:hypothetical protein [Tahibacter amnicola]UXI66256.1 hypothetical protein N4264_16025 [Tahibacter amnicola]